MDYRNKVRKLMTQAREATAAGREHEAQAFAEMAAALATKHGVEDALTEAFDDRPVKLVLKKVTMGSPYPKHRISLIAAIARHQGCKVVKNGRNIAEVFGEERSVERVMFAYRLISVHMLDAVGKARPELPEFVEDKHRYFSKDGLTPAETKSFRVSWIIGYINGINERMAAAYKAVVEEQKTVNPGTALVLSDRKALVERFVTETYGKLGKVARSKVTNAGAYFAGKAASSGADLGQTRIDSRRELTAS